MSTPITITAAQSCARTDHSRPTMAGTINAKWRAFKRWRGRRRTEKILAGLSERTLKDIGLSRDEIGSVVNGSPDERVRRYDESWNDRQCAST